MHNAGAFEVTLDLKQYLLNAVLKCLKHYANPLIFTKALHFNHVRMYTLRRPFYHC